MASSKGKNMKRNFK